MSKVQSRSEPPIPLPEVDLDALVMRIAAHGNLPLLISKACRAATTPPTSGGIDWSDHPQALRAALAFDLAEREADPMATQRMGWQEPDEFRRDVPGGNQHGPWMAWSADGSRLLASGPSIEAVELLAAEAGELTPLLEMRSGVDEA